MSAILPARPRKRLFLGLTLAGFLVSCAVAFAAWRLASPGLSQISPWLPWVVAAALALLVLVVAFGVGLIILAALGFPVLTVAQRLAWWALNLLFPVVITLGRLLDFDRPRIERSFIELSNHLVRGRSLHISPDRVLILVPHCIQLDLCNHRITHKIENCKQCGRCPVGDLLRIALQLGVHLAVVPGGTLARQVVKSLRPRAVLAIACERDLVSGIQDIFPLPVVGVLNDRPNGPCCNTTVDIDAVERNLRAIVAQR